MRLSLAARVALSALWLSCCAAWAAACSSASTSGARTGSGGFGTTPPDAGADAADAGPAPSLAFEPASALTLNPKATRALKVVTTPAGIFQVRFALLGSGSDSAPGDAALDANMVQTDNQGVAQVTLTAPSTPTRFTLRASVGTSQTLLAISVKARNYTTLRVLPSYSGKRPVSAWTATAQSGVTCAKLVGNPPPDGDLTTTAAAADVLELDQVPVGVALAVTLRAGHYLGGCADQSALEEADGNQVLVYASDRPVNLAATQLDLSFGPTDPTSALSKLLNAAASEALNALGNASTSDVSGLLDAMNDATASASRDAFSAARQTYLWDSELSAAFGDGAATRLRDPAGRWLSAGLARFYAADTFSAQLGAPKSGAVLDLVSVAQVPAATAGFATTFQATWSADSNDTLLLGTELAWLPSRLVTALAALPAGLEFPEASSVEGALAQSVDCTLVASTLLEHGTVVGSAAYDGCDQSCALSTCTAAVAALWKKASNASGSTSASLSVTGTGAAQVGDDASITSLSGSWVGQLQVATDSAPAAGSLSASSSAAN